MMRPMKLAGSELMFGEGSLEYIRNIPERRIFIVIGGKSMEKNGVLDRVFNLFKENGADVCVFKGVEPDPSFRTVMKGAEKMKEFQPDLIVGLGGGSVMDAAKTMWAYYENPEWTTLADVLSKAKLPNMCEKARYLCIPTTSGTASEVSRSIVITDDEKGLKHGYGNMAMMPNIAICDPAVTLSLPAKTTAETGMDALTHALEALVSNRANYLSDILASAAVKDIIHYLPLACADGSDMEAREHMMNASMTAGMAFTNVSLGIVHSLAQTLGGYFHASHGLLDAIILPYIIRYNSQREYANKKYKAMAAACRSDDLAVLVEELNAKLGIPKTLQEVILDETKYLELVDEMAEASKNDGCTKTNPVIPEVDGFAGLLKLCYYGK
ncbi:MAG: iron-containing alcohol dehydrogenase [Lachnospiraceae bacterium]|nr:iron-containing alcohol dehydrogenase [Lachnospiraceae bacterium]